MEKFEYNDIQVTVTNERKNERRDFPRKQYGILTYLCGRKKKKEKKQLTFRSGSEVTNEMIRYFFFWKSNEARRGIERGCLRGKCPGCAKKRFRKGGCDRRGGGKNEEVYG